MKRCSILLVGARRGDRRASELRQLGFVVSPVVNLPANDRLLSHFVIVVTNTPPPLLPTTGARLRAKPAFGRRVMVSVVPDDTPRETVRSLLLCGFDEVFFESNAAETIVAGIVRRLMTRPELQCDIPPVPQAPAA
jgi:hypothetical protein